MELKEKLLQAYLAKGTGYHPRTAHFNADGTPTYINRLIFEDSPYLIQHAHNPVDWHAWSDKAFARAKKEEKPVFLSIGYSTCHWCHVMERESFEDPVIAALLNEHFIPIKVDRESHPDVDQVYMTAVMLMTGHGGWPMSTFLTPEGKPFFGGTYYRPDQFSALLTQVAQLWREQPGELQSQARRVAAAVSENNRLHGGSQTFDPVVAKRAVSAMEEIFDRLDGGFGQAPKFPREPWLFLLLDQAERAGDPQALTMLSTTLERMAGGGIHDQIGGGFHRYSTDYEWLVPHFEKMLYNQALLSRLYLGAWRLTGKQDYRRIATRTLDYVLREMRSPEGGFYSATDADSEGVEGRFFTWTRAEIRAALTQEDGELATSLYGISRIGNFEGRNIPHLEQNLDEYAEKHGMAPEALRRRLDHIDSLLLAVRDRRVAPLRDEKIISAWNGMMITALAEAADLLGSEEYRRAAEAAADFLWRHNRRESGRLWRVHFDGRSSTPAAQEDYAYLAEGLIALYDLTGEKRWLARAGELTEALLARFLDNRDGGFYINEAAAGITAMERPRDDGLDSATPSASAVALRVLQRMWRRTGDQSYRRHSDKLIDRFTPSLERMPHNFSYMLVAILERQQGELGEKGYAAQGGIRLEAGLTPPRDGRRQLRIDLHIPSGWHINSHQPGNADLIATRLSLPDESGWKLATVSYPAGEPGQAGLQNAPASFYSGQVRLLARLEPGSTRPASPSLPVRIHLQACNEQSCLPPEQITLRVAMHGAEQLRESSE